MFLRVKRRLKDGKEHRYWSIVENHRKVDIQVVQSHVLYLGEINDSQQASWVKTIAVMQQGDLRGKQMALFAADRPVPELACETVRIHMNALELHRPRQWGACWLACQLWSLLDLDSFWSDRLPPSRQKTRWLHILKTLVCYRLIAPGSEWRLHREWYRHSAMGDLNIRPIYHQTDQRIEAHIFVAFLAYCLQVTLKYQAQQRAPGLTPRSILEKFSALQMVDVHLPTTDGRRFILSRYTQPDKDQKLLLHQLHLTLPQQPPPCLAVQEVPMSN
jgi:hypothetical protein